MVSRTYIQADRVPQKLMRRLVAYEHGKPTQPVSSPVTPGPLIMAIFHCNLCTEKDKRIDDHQREIARLVTQMDMLNQLVFPKNRPETTAEALEFNRIIDGSFTEVESTSEEII